MREDPFACHNIGATRRLRNETPCPVVDEHLVLISHGRTPVSVGPRRCDSSSESVTVSRKM
jgi:hypothetical protein